MIKGLIAPILTPFNDDLGIAGDLYTDFARHLLADGGCAGLAPFGTTGEALSVGVEERITALDTLIDGGVDPARLIPGTGVTNLADTTRLTRHAMERGCHGAMILPPFYYKNPAEEGIIAFYERLIDMVNHPDLKIYLYHIPQVAGVGISPDTVRRLHEKFPSIIVGIKDSSGDWKNTEALLGIKNLITYPGAELPIIEAMRLGAPGCISATANLNGVAISEVIGLCAAGEWEKAEKAHEAVKATRMLFQDYAPIPAQKAILARQSGEARWANLRPPLLPLADDAVSALESALQAHGGLAA